MDIRKLVLYELVFGMSIATLVGAIFGIGAGISTVIMLSGVQLTKISKNISIRTILKIESYFSIEIANPEQTVPDVINNEVDNEIDNEVNSEELLSIVQTPSNVEIVKAIENLSYMNVTPQFKIKINSFKNLSNVEKYPSYSLAA